MKLLKIATALILVAATPAVAQSTATTTATAPAVAAKLTAEMPIEAIAADPSAKAALDANFPGLTTHAMYEQFKGMTLKQLQPMAAGQVTDEAIAKLSTDLAAVK